MPPIPQVNRPNWLLIKGRQWHRWIGVVVALAITVTALTGILINHAALLERQPRKEQAAGGLLATTTRAGALPVSFDQALATAQSHWGAGAGGEDRTQS